MRRGIESGYTDSHFTGCIARLWAFSPGILLACNRLFKRCHASLHKPELWGIYRKSAGVTLVYLDLYLNLLYEFAFFVSFNRKLMGLLI